MVAQRRPEVANFGNLWLPEVANFGNLWLPEVTFGCLKLNFGLPEDANFGSFGITYEVLFSIRLRT